MLSVLGLTAQLLSGVPVDTPPPPPSRRVRAVEVSDAYNKRLTLHRRLSYATVPLFLFQWTAGEQLIEKGADAPAWARTSHQIGATAIAAVFAVNTVTGVMNLWESRKVPQGRRRRNLHAISMLVADAGFTYAGAVLSQRAKTDSTMRPVHRKVALTSMGIAVTSGVLMKIFNK
jgi:hypothetical protein